MQRRTDMRKGMMQFHPPSCHADAGGNYLIAPIVSTFGVSPLRCCEDAHNFDEGEHADAGSYVGNHFNARFLLASGSISTEDLDPLPVKRRYLRRL